MSPKRNMQRTRQTCFQNREVRYCTLARHDPHIGLSGELSETLVEMANDHGVHTYNDCGGNFSIGGIRRLSL